MQYVSRRKIHIYAGGRACRGMAVQEQIIVPAAGVCLCRRSAVARDVRKCRQPIQMPEGSMSKMRTEQQEVVDRRHRMPDPPDRMCAPQDGEVDGGRTGK